MLAKCANPLCSASFHPLDENKLFQLGTDPTLGSSEARAEYFWLCHRCSSVMTLRLKRDGAVGTVLLLETLRGVSARATLTLAHRQIKLVLCDVSTSLSHLGATFLLSAREEFSQSRADDGSQAVLTSS
jgi:hypothetical protein